MKRKTYKRSLAMGIILMVTLLSTFPAISSSMQGTVETVEITKPAENTWYYDDEEYLPNFPKSNILIWGDITVEVTASSNISNVTFWVEDTDGNKILAGWDDTSPYSLTLTNQELPIKGSTEKYEIAVEGEFAENQYATDYVVVYKCKKIADSSAQASVSMVVKQMVADGQMSMEEGSLILEYLEELCNQQQNSNA